MRFSFSEAMCDPAQYVPLARACERAGIDTFNVPDSIFYPEHADDIYPYTPDGKRAFLEDKPFIEPFTLVPALAAVTEKLLFATFVYKLPIRQPVLVAKGLASVAVMSNDRFKFGVGLSPWPQDFAGCGQDWKSRGKRMDEMIEIIRGLLRGDFFSYESEHYSIPSIKIDPVPRKPVKFLIGGHADAALRRAARIGDGWMMAGFDADLLHRQLDTLNRYLDEYGRDRSDFEIHVIPLGAKGPDDFQRLADKGVTDILVGARNSYADDRMTLEQKVEWIERFGANVLSKIR
ncbi:MAG: TIGR03619 family F420-dependent LLM class oxidoreductase [Myxococcota bacterium]|nr:TIGR03619 family F420-dependent LLM class oxidoreductase [Myxococcales bacterium]